jgi:dihydroorotate dehydrogenase
VGGAATVMDGIKAILAGADVVQMVSALLLHAAIKAYDDALSGVLPPTVIDVVETQREQMRATQKRIHELTQAL